MGVHGLTSYLALHSSLGSTVILSPDCPSPQTALIVDGLALLYHIALIDPARGGQFKQVRANLAKYIKYWRACGFVPELVFDGPSEHTKRDTVLSRSTQTMQKCIAYMEASDAERATPRLRAYAQRMPGMTLSACVAELRKLGVPLHFAEGEADAGAAELAERRGGYVVSSDSDYFIFRANHRGYIPLTSIEYGESSGNRLELIDSVLPVSLRFKVFRHTEVARLLGLPPQFLPLFAALVGNDQADYAAQFVLPPTSAGAAPSQRKGKGKGKKGGKGGGVKVGDRAGKAKVDKLLLPHIARELAKLTHLAPLLDQPPAPNTPDPHSTILNLVLPSLGVPNPPLQMIHDLLLSCASYALQPLDKSSSTFPLHPRATDSPYQAASRALYLAAFKRGELFSSFLQVLKHRMVLRSGSLEMADRPSPTQVLGTPIRRWIYALMRDGLFSEEQEEDLVVSEWQRVGNALRETTVQVPRLGELVLEAMGAPEGEVGWQVEQPIIQGSPQLRFQLLLLAFGGLPNAAQMLQNPLWPLVLALRHIRSRILVHPWTSHDFLSGDGGWGNEGGRGEPREARLKPKAQARLADTNSSNSTTGARSSHPWTSHEFLSALTTAALLLGSTPPPHFKLASPPSRVFIQRSTELSTSLALVGTLAEALLVVGELGEGVSRLFDGKLFHGCLGVGEERVGKVVRGLKGREREWVQEAFEAVMS